MSLPALVPEAVVIITVSVKIYIKPIFIWGIIPFFPNILKSKKFPADMVKYSVQKDFDSGADRDSGYIYGPTLPRCFFMGIRLNY